VPLETLLWAVGAPGPPPFALLCSSVFSFSWVFFGVWRSVLFSRFAPRCFFLGAGTCALRAFRLGLSRGLVVPVFETSAPGLHNDTGATRRTFVRFTQLPVRSPSGMFRNPTPFKRLRHSHTAYSTAGRPTPLCTHFYDTTRQTFRNLLGRRRRATKDTTSPTNTATCLVPERLVRLKEAFESFG